MKTVGQQKSHNKIGRYLPLVCHRLNLESVLSRCTRREASRASESKQKCVVHDDEIKIRRSAIVTAQRASCETWNAHPSYCGWVPFGPNFPGTESFSGKMLIPLVWLETCCASKAGRQRFLVSVATMLILFLSVYVFHSFLVYFYLNFIVYFCTMFIINK